MTYSPSSTTRFTDWRSHSVSGVASGRPRSSASRPPTWSMARPGRCFGSVRRSEGGQVLRDARLRGVGLSHQVGQVPPTGPGRRASRRRLDLGRPSVGLEVRRRGGRGVRRRLAVALGTRLPTHLGDVARRCRRRRPAPRLSVDDWEDPEAFLQHYRGASSPEVQRRVHDSVDWL